MDVPNWEHSIYIDKDRESINGIFMGGRRSRVKSRIRKSTYNCLHNIRKMLLFHSVGGYKTKNLDTRLHEEGTLGNVATAGGLIFRSRELESLRTMVNTVLQVMW